MASEGIRPHIRWNTSSESARSTWYLPPVWFHLAFLRPSIALSRAFSFVPGAQMIPDLQPVSQSEPSQSQTHARALLTTSESTLSSLPSSNLPSNNQCPPHIANNAFQPPLDRPFVEPRKKARGIVPCLVRYCVKCRSTIEVGQGNGDHQLLVHQQSSRCISGNRSQINAKTGNVID